MSFYTNQICFWFWKQKHWILFLSCLYFSIYIKEVRWQWHLGISVSCLQWLCAVSLTRYSTCHSVRQSSSFSMLFLGFGISNGRENLESTDTAAWGKPHSPHIHLTSNVHEKRAIRLLQWVQILKKLLSEKRIGERQKTAMVSAVAAGRDPLGVWHCWLWLYLLMTS